MIDRRIGAVVFDIGRVLASIDVAKTVGHIAQLSGCEPFEAEFALFGPHHRQFNRGEIDGRAFHEAVCRALGRELTFEAFVTAWCDMFETVHEMEGILAPLSHRYPIYLCSNTDALHYRHLRTHNPLLSFAKAAVLSFEVHAEKPEPEIYQALAQVIDEEPSETIFIDDRVDNVAAAREGGFIGIVFEGAESLRADLVRLGAWDRGHSPPH